METGQSEGPAVAAAGGWSGAGSSVLLPAHSRRTAAKLDGDGPDGGLGVKQVDDRDPLRFGQVRGRVLPICLGVATTARRQAHEKAQLSTSTDSGPARMATASFGSLERPKALAIAGPKQNVRPGKAPAGRVVDYTFAAF
jgi:hypothetical protein